MLLKKKGLLLFSFIGFCFFFFTITGYHLAQQGNIVWTGWYAAGVLGSSLAAGSVAGSLVCLAMYKIIGREKKEKESKLRLPGSTGCFFLSWLLIAASWFPGYLAYYPAICSYDITIQLSQILSGEYIDHHPLVHTLLLQGSMWFGEKVLGSVNTGIALFAFLQMAALSAVFAGGIGVLRKRKAGKIWLAALLVYGMFFPFHMYMSISLTKDTLFTVFMAAGLLVLNEIIYQGNNSWRLGKWDILYLICLVGMILFRNNGKYAMLVLLVFCGLAAVFGKARRKLFLRILSEGILGLILGTILLSGVYRLLDAQPADKREMLSMPIQQLARCMIYHGGAGVLPEDDNTMEEQDKALIHDFILNQAYTRYRPDISDPVKGNTNTYVVRYRLKDFAGTYFRLLLKYPGDFANAVLAVNAGYLYPGDVSHAVINVNGRDRGLGYIQTRWVEAELNPAGIYKDSKWEWLHEKLEDYADENAYLSVPVLKYLMVPGTYLWLYLLLAGWLILRRQYRALLPLTLVFGYYATLFLGPTVQLRYLYPVMVSLPFLFVRCVTGFRTGCDCTSEN